MKKEQSRDEAGIPTLIGVWGMLALSTGMSVVQFRGGEDVWGLVFAVCAAFFAVALWGMHTQRIWNRRGRPAWAKRNGRRS